MIRNLEKANSQNIDNMFNIRQAELIKVKYLLQDKFGLPTSWFTSFGLDSIKDPTIIPIMQAKLKELEQQGVTVTPLQMASALSSVINGGTRYEPYLVDGFADSQGNVNYNKPKVIASNVVSSNTSNSMISLLETVVKKHEEAGFKYLAFPSGYNIGGKTGTAQVPKPDGGYYDNKFNGTYLGFVGGNKPQYSVAIFVTTPTVPGYAGSYGAQPIFGNIAHMLINQSYVTPIGQ